jgi:hypothetical protein
VAYSDLMPAKIRKKTEFVAPALSTVLLKTCSALTAALVLAACAVAAAAQDDSPAFAKFKREMMPKVGQKITVVGTWDDRMKQCCFLAFNKWGAYVYAGESGIARERELFAHFRNGQTVKLTGTLRYYPGPDAATRKHAQTVQFAPEHFFFDAAEVEMSRWPPPQNPKK